MLTLSSCREDDMDHVGNSNTSIVEKYEKNQAIRNAHDSISVSTLSNSEESSSTLVDPPPKDRGQW
ncbi:MAG: hypothetical protein LBF27_06085 [Sphingobacterium sp.]|nr:hypothetical protein [Sphingobacterium sp.]